jgi:ATP-dependent DNA helicase RecG
MLSFSDSITKISGIKPYQEIKLNNLGIFLLEDLLYHFPFRYDDFSSFKKIDALKIGETVTVQGIVESIKTSRTWKKRMTITEAQINDGTTSIKAVWFNSPLPTKYLIRGKYIQLSGKIVPNKQKQPHFQHPNFEFITKSQFETSLNSTNDSNDTTELAQKTGGGINTGNLTPVYPETQGITSYFLRRIIKNALANTEIIEFLPTAVTASQKLPSLETALKNIHFPASLKQAETAKKRFAFEKMLLFQTKLLQTKKSWETNSAVSLKFNKKFIKSFVDSLPFKLTNSQKKSAWQIIQDLEKKKPMNRLLEGDVGTGKTIVAMLAILSVVKNKSQAAIVAPTEVLANQHFKTISHWLPSNFTSGLLTASRQIIGEEKVSKKILKQELKRGTIDVVIGTHALFQKEVNFKKLALVIVDEQHRFGVNQRAFLLKKTGDIEDGSKKSIPHFLTMTATPIPRTLSLALFGNLDLSIINEFPKDRKMIFTRVIQPQGRQQIYEFIKNQLISGRQAFVICPLVEESSKISEVKAATEEYQRLQKKIFPNFKLELLHGKMKSKDKGEIMQRFKDKKADILVSTSVIEVGIDIPNATIMIIEGAERFGLSQLHQFRGRVGRGAHQSYCFLLTSNNTSPTTKRLSVLEKTNNGFKIAEEDMKLRGPGQFLGTLQSGIPDITMESLTDTETIQSARLIAERLLKTDSALQQFPLFKKQVEKLNSQLHLE